MRRPRKRGRSRGRRGENPSPEGQTTATAMNLVLDEMAMGIPNITRRFTLDRNSSPSRFETPPYFLQFVRPLAVFIQGWSQSSSGNFDNSELGDALSLSEDDNKKVLYARTPYAKHWQDTVWPVMEDLFQSGVGARYAVSQPEVIRYFAHALFAYSLAYMAIVNNEMSFRYDWSQAVPHSPTVPPSIYTLNDLYGARNPDLARKWRPLFERIEELVLPPALVGAIQRVLTPFSTMGMGPKPIWPIADWKQVKPWSWKNDGGDDDWAKVCKDHLDFIDKSLTQTSNLIRTFLPFPVAVADPWNVAAYPYIDPVRASAMENAPIRDTVIFGTGSTQDYPSVDEGPRWYQTDDGIVTMPVYSPAPRVTFGELQFMGAFLVDARPSVGNDFWLVTPHQYNGMACFGDNFDPANSDSYLQLEVDADFTDNFARYLKTFPAHRWVSADNDDVEYGFMLPGTIVTEITYEGAERLIDLAVERDWDYGVMRQVVFASIGTALREIRPLYLSMQVAAVSQKIQAASAI